MAGKHHEICPDQEIIRKSQISDEPGKWTDNIKNIGDIKNLNKVKLLKECQDQTKIENNLKTGIHFYTLSIMNETNKVSRHKI